MRTFGQVVAIIETAPPAIVQVKAYCSCMIESFRGDYMAHELERREVDWYPGEFFKLNETQLKLHIQQHDTVCPHLKKARKRKTNA
jgi:hypothetical protein